MNLSQLHFAFPLWFLMLLVIPIVWGLFFLFYRGKQPLHQLEKFIDKHLIPYLLVTNPDKKEKLWAQPLFWSLVWSCLVVALTGPRWDFREITTFTRDQSLAILLDLSESMNAKDVPPSRLGRAKQKVQDLLNISQGVKIGLIAFAADPHMIVPMTEDKETIRHLLPSLNTDLIYVQGSKLTPALEMAATMLEGELSNNKAIVVISDGGFEDASAIHTAKRLAEGGIAFYTMGIGSLEGVPMKDPQGSVIKKNGFPIISKLEREKLVEISKKGNGRYFDASHSEQVALIFEDLKARSDIQQETQKTQRLWKEHFYLFLLPVIPFFLCWFRRGYIFPILFFSLTPTPSQASLCDYFYNSEQQANWAYENEDYPTASCIFQDAYRKGVAYYRMGDYAAAEAMFRQSTRPEVASNAAYNLGNALVQQNKLNEAIAAYENVLERWPNHKQAKENLELVKKTIEQEKQQQKNEKQQKKEQEERENLSQKKEASNQPKEQPKKDSPSEESESEEKNESDPTKKQGHSHSEERSQNISEENPSIEDDTIAQQQKTQPFERERGKPNPRSQEDLDADLWLNQIKNDPKPFLKNKFYLESKKNGTKGETDPW